MNLFTIFTILGIHWFADFFVQTDDQAKGKSKSWNYLLGHTFSYSIVWAVPICLLSGIIMPNKSSFWYINVSFLFILITFLSHTLIDYFTSRLNSRLWSRGKTHEFFVSIGFDQWLHYVQLFTTFYLLTKL